MHQMARYAFPLWKFSRLSRYTIITLQKEYNILIKLNFQFFQLAYLYSCHLASNSSPSELNTPDMPLAFIIETPMHSSFFQLKYSVPQTRYPSIIPSTSSTRYSGHIKIFPLKLCPQNKQNTAASSPLLFSALLRELSPPSDLREQDPDRLG